MIDETPKSTATHTPVEASADATDRVGLAKAEATEIMRDPDSPYWNKNDPRHREVADKVEQLYKTAYGEELATKEDGSRVAFDKEIEDAMTPPEDGYKFQANLREDEVWDTELDTAAQGWFYEAGISEAEAQSLVKHWRESEIGPSDEEREFRRRDASEYLQRLWGDDFDSNMNGVRAVAKSLGPNFMNFANRTGLGDDRVVLQTLHRVALTKGVK